MENAAFVVYQRRFSTPQRVATENSGCIPPGVERAIKRARKPRVGWKGDLPVVPPKVEYYLTDFGKSLIPVIGAIGQWGDEHDQRLRTLIEKNIQS